ncbi:GNAT family N-acetyltransferase [Paenibacillus humicola]|uniref:GNAT family N-acetyltransferase n=1 Tax=Paenibacillus humicola TaxID=3110540 RepID=UPI00237BD646|nr:GNAT family N-acetyltransferase [Paenibacillus humicola]
MAAWTIREANAIDAPAVARVHVDCWRSTYKDLIPADFLQGLSYRSREERWRRRLEHPPDRSTLFVAEDHAGRILGFADGGPERSGDPEYDGELYAIYLLPEHQRKGIGRRLFRSAAAYLAEHRFNAC